MVGESESQSAAEEKRSGAGCSGPPKDAQESRQRRRGPRGQSNASSSSSPSSSSLSPSSSASSASLAVRFCRSSAQEKLCRFSNFSFNILWTCPRRFRARRSASRLQPRSSHVCNLWRPFLRIPRQICLDRGRSPAALNTACKARGGAVAVIFKMTTECENPMGAEDFLSSARERLLPAE